MTVVAGAKRMGNAVALASSGPSAPEAAATDLTRLTNPELRALCEERGIEVPKGRPTKADLIALLG